MSTRLVFHAFNIVGHRKRITPDVVTWLLIEKTVSTSSETRRVETHRSNTGRIGCPTSRIITTDFASGTVVPTHNEQFLAEPVEPVPE